MAKTEEQKRAEAKLGRCACGEEAVDRISVAGPVQTCEHCGAERATYRYQGVCKQHLSEYRGGTTTLADLMLMRLGEGG